MPRSGACAPTLIRSRPWSLPRSPVRNGVGASLQWPSYSVDIAPSRASSPMGFGIAAAWMKRTREGIHAGATSPLASGP